MDFTKITCISSVCKDKNQIMEGAGAQFGGRITIVKVKCPVCETVLMVIPMSKQYEYKVSATTEEERKEERIRKAKDAAELELAKTITRIQETGY